MVGKVECITVGRTYHALDLDGCRPTLPFWIIANNYVSGTDLSVQGLPSQAYEFLFAQGWDKYHDRFFTRCYVQEGEAAYDKAVKSQQKHVDQSSSS